MIPSCVENNQLHAHICSAISDPVRIQLLYLVAEHPCNVSQLVDLLELPQPTVSRHLGSLRAAELVLTERRGRNVFYSLADPRVIQALDIMRAILKDRITAHSEALS